MAQQRPPSSANAWPSDENTDLIPRVVRARRLRGVVSLVLGLVILAGAGVTFAVPTLGGEKLVEPATKTALEMEAGAISSALDAAARAAHVRADRIATHDMVRAAIQTDAATAADMMQSDFDKTPIKDEKLIKGETLELFQLDGGKPLSLASMPVGAPQLGVLAGHGTRVRRDGDGLAMIVSAPVQRFKDGPGYKPVDGSLVMSIPVDLAFLRQQATNSALAARLVGLDQPITLVAGDGAGGPELHFPVTVDKSWGASLELVATPKTTTGRARWVAPVRYSALGVGIALLVAALLAFRRR